MDIHFKCTSTKKKLQVHRGKHFDELYTSAMTSGGLCKTLSPSALFTAVILLSVMRLLRMQRQSRFLISIFVPLGLDLETKNLSHTDKCSREIGLSEPLSVSLGLSC